MALLKTGDQPPRGPNLLGKAGKAASQPDGHRILSQLEHGATASAAALPAARWRPGWWRWAAGAACAGLVGLVLLADDTAGLPAPASPPAPAAARVEAAAPAAMAQHAATIVNDAGPASPLAAPAGTNTPRKAPPPLRQAATRAPAPRPAATAPGDSDVALLTAMVAHAHRQEGTAAPVRDVVLRKEEEETASLLQRCKQLGMIEGMLCRSRICSGRWDSDPACH